MIKPFNCSMRRIHLFEFEDLQWFPRILRNYMTDYLQFVANQADFYKNILPIIKKGLAKSGTSTVVDLASGGGGGWVKLAPRLQAAVPDLSVILTDFYPNIPAFQQTVQQNPEIISYQTEPVNALAVPSHLKGLRTQFLSFHHFKPENARRILKNALDTNASILIVEAQERNWSTLLQFALSPIFVLLGTPFIRPFKIGRILLTYFPPLVPLFVWWDGLVSVLRTYSVDEMRKMANEVDPDQTYEWDIGKVKDGPITLPYLLGCPKS